MPGCHRTWVGYYTFVPQESAKKQKVGAAPVDSLCPLASSGGSVYEGYDAMLNQTDIGNNNNKFYIIQLLKVSAKKEVYVVWNRWGRVGVPGQSKAVLFDDVEK